MNMRLFPALKLCENVVQNRSRDKLAECLLIYLFIFLLYLFAYIFPVDSLQCS